MNLIIQRKIDANGEFQSDCTFEICVSVVSDITGLIEETFEHYCQEAWNILVREGKISSDLSWNDYVYTEVVRVNEVEA
ncbi:MAG: hypothetical protein HQ498_03970 [Pseudohongiella sp.]|jgi:hypothetical protein|nr:hypothetical protein [Pseudohongiella sp.]